MALKRSLPEIIPLTSLRGIAAMMVLLGHLRHDLFYFFDFGIFKNLFIEAGLYVDLFFVLSGFILAYNYSHIFSFYGVGSKVKSFLIARFARVYPLHILILCILLLLLSIKYVINEIANLSEDYLFLEGRNFAGFLANVFLIQIVHEQFSWNPPSWSISTEFFAYLVFPLLFLKRLNIQSWILIFLLFSGLIVFLYSFSEATSFPFNLIRCIYEFILGVALFQIWRRIKKFSNSLLSLFQIICFIVPFVAIILNWPTALVVLSWIFLVISLATNHGVLARAMAWKPFHFIGQISYSIYMIHWLVIMLASDISNLVTKFSPNINLDFLMVVKIIIVFIGTFVLSWLSYRFFEKPVRALIVK
jgi:peptidoglycan/LPS O-acetylase OafA/YrhL